jgi:hypothetical protein
MWSKKSKGAKEQVKAKRKEDVNSEYARLNNKGAERLQVRAQTAISLE